MKSIALNFHYEGSDNTPFQPSFTLKTMDDYKTPGKKIALSRSQLQTIYTLIQRPDVHQLPAESIQRPIVEWHGNRDLDIIELVTKFKRGHDTLTTQIRDSLQNDATAKAQAVNSAQSLWNTTAPSV